MFGICDINPRNATGKIQPIITKIRNIFAEKYLALFQRGDESRIFLQIMSLTLGPIITFKFWVGSLYESNSPITFDNNVDLKVMNILSI